MGFEIDASTQVLGNHCLSFKVSSAMYLEMRRLAKAADIGVSTLARQMVGHCLAEMDTKAGGESRG